MVPRAGLFVNGNHEQKHVLCVEWHLGLGFSEAAPEERTRVPAVYLGNETGNTWKWNGEVKQGRKGAKDFCCP